MAKTVSDVAKTTSSQSRDSKKQLKKQAKRGAKLQLKLDQAKRDARKAEKKVTRAQSRLVEAQTQVHDLEEQLSQHRSSRQSLNGASSVGDDTHQAQAEQESLEVLTVDTAAPITQDEAHQESLPLAEEPADVPAEQIVAEISDTQNAAEDKALADEENADHAVSEEKSAAQENEPVVEASDETSDETSAKGN